MPLLLLLDFSNHVFAEMDGVIDAFLAENADAARELVAEFNELQRDDPDLKAERSKLEYKLRRLLGAHAKAFKTKLTQDLGKDKVQLLEPGKQQPRLATSAGTDSSTDSSTAAAAAVEQQAAVAAAAEQLQETLQQEGSVHLVVVADAGKHSRWKTQQLVVTKAKQLAEQLGVADEEFSEEAAAAAPPTAEEQQLQKAEVEQQQVSTAADVQEAGEEEAKAAAEQQLDSDVNYRLKGALLFIARYTLEQALLPDKPLLVPGCTADEAIAALVAANAALLQPHPLCIKSDDSDFWQLRGYGRCSSSSTCSSGSSCPQEQQQYQQEQLEFQQQQQQQQVYEVSSEDNGQEHSQEEYNQQHDSDDPDQQQQDQQQQQWLFQCGIKWALCCSADTMPRDHQHKCALLGKGREDLLQCGTAFGPVPTGLTVEDAAGTSVQGQARPGDEMYLQQYAAFDAAVRGEAAWSLELPALLEWLQQFRHQSPAIRARFLVKMVQHSIDPFCRWSAMPADLQDTCRKAAADVLAEVPKNTTTSSSSKLGKQQQGGSNGAAAGSSHAGSKGSSSSSSSRKKKSSGNKKKQKKNHRHR